MSDHSWFWLSCLGTLVYWPQTLLNYLAFQYFDIERTWWRHFQIWYLSFYYYHIYIYIFHIITIVVWQFSSETNWHHKVRLFCWSSLGSFALKLTEIVRIIWCKVFIEPPFKAMVYYETQDFVDFVRIVSSAIDINVWWNFKTESVMLWNISVWSSSLHNYL